MAAGQYSFTLEQGSTLDFNIEYSGSDGAPVDLSGYEARMHIREQKDSSNVICTLSSSLDIDGTGLNMTPPSGSFQGEVFPKSSGSIKIFISAASSSNFSFTKAYYDLEIYSGSNYPIVTRILEGRIKLNKEVTR
jgi:hypothetical protein